MFVTLLISGLHEGDARADVNNIYIFGDVAPHHAPLTGSTPCVSLAV